MIPVEIPRRPAVGELHLIAAGLRDDFVLMMRVLALRHHSGSATGLQFRYPWVWKRRRATARVVDAAERLPLRDTFDQKSLTGEAVVRLGGHSQLVGLGRSTQAVDLPSAHRAREGTPPPHRAPPPDSPSGGALAGGQGCRWHRIRPTRHRKSLPSAACAAGSQARLGTASRTSQYKQHGPNRAAESSAEKRAAKGQPFTILVAKSRN